MSTYKQRDAYSWGGGMFTHFERLPAVADHSTKFKPRQVSPRIIGGPPPSDHLQRHPLRGAGGVRMGGRLEPK